MQIMHNYVIFNCQELKPYLDLDFSGELNSDFEIVEAGVQGKLKLLNDTLS